VLLLLLLLLFLRVVVTSHHCYGRSIKILPHQHMPCLGFLLCTAASNAGSIAALLACTVMVGYHPMVHIIIPVVWGVHLQAKINSPEARAAAAAAAEAAAEDEVGPLHEENEWGIEVVAEPAAAGESGGAPAAGSEATGGDAAAAAAAAAPLPEGLEFSMPAASGVDAAVLQQDAVKPTDASLDDLTNMLSSLNK
jgi:hypothetical protein